MGETVEYSLNFDIVEIHNFTKFESDNGFIYGADFKMKNSEIEATVAIKPQPKEWWLNVADNVPSLKHIILSLNF